VVQNDAGAGDFDKAIAGLGDAHGLVMQVQEWLVPAIVIWRREKVVAVQQPCEDLSSLVFKARFVFAILYSGNAMRL